MSVTTEPEPLKKGKNVTKYLDYVSPFFIVLKFNTKLIIIIKTFYHYVYE